MKIYDDINLNSNSVVNGKFETVNELPTTGNVNGRIVYLSTDNRYYYYNNEWVSLVNSVDLGDISTILSTVVEVG